MTHPDRSRRPVAAARAGAGDHRRPDAQRGRLLAVEAGRRPRVLTEGRRLVWTDDEALPAVGRDREEFTAQGRALLIAPRPNRGLQPADLDQIEAFLESRRS